MSLISFIKDAGEKLFNRGGGASAPPAPTPQAPAAAAPTPGAADIAQLNATAGQAIQTYITSQNLSAENLQVAFDGATGTVTVSGTAPDQATREKIVLCCGNVSGVEKVDDRMTVTVAATEPPARFHTVAKGDTLSAVAKQVYGNATLYMKIFEANKPMLSHPDKIYPGQVLRIPA